MIGVGLCESYPRVPTSAKDDFVPPVVKQRETRKCQSTRVRKLPFGFNGILCGVNFDFNIFATSFRKSGFYYLKKNREYKVNNYDRVFIQFSEKK